MACLDHLAALHHAQHVHTSLALPGSAPDTSQCGVDHTTDGALHKARAAQEGQKDVIALSDFLAFEVILDTRFFLHKELI